MKIHFYLRYTTTFGDSISLTTSEGLAVPLTYVNQEFWHGVLTPAKPIESLQYSYQVNSANGGVRREWNADRIVALDAAASTIQIIDAWDAAGDAENAFFTQPFQEIFFKNTATAAKTSKKAAKSKEKSAKVTHVFKAKAPLLHSGEALCLLGQGDALNNWSTDNPIFMEKTGNWWSAPVDLSDEDTVPSYKYGIWDTAANKFKSFEAGENRLLLSFAQRDLPALTVLHDGLVRFTTAPWRGAGVAIPVFSLRSEQSFGVGEFTDLPLLADWASGIGMRVIQLLPINDTSATDTWTDSYPYAAISAFALHPIYLNVAEVAGKAQAALVKPYAKQQKALNALPDVDYEAVLKAKWEIIKALYAAQKAYFEQDKDYKEYFEENENWLVPYAAFCCLKNRYDTTDFNQWPEHSVYEAKNIAKLTASNSKTYDEVAIHYFVQWHLHRQLKAATDYIHAKGLAVKGDIPIGIYRYSCDAWVAPELYNMDKQTGAPPDDFAEKGQNWGFPTYNWARMKSDGFAWWQQRFHQMSHYFDMFRIDHILGFFRIWSIPLDAVEGILGYFVPAIPVTERELYEAGVGFNYERLCKPFISERALWEYFGAEAGTAAEQFLMPLADGRLVIKPEFATQRQVEAYFNNQPGTEQNIKLRDGLYALISNIILIDAGDGAYHFRFGIEKTISFQSLESVIQERLKNLYVNYFYRRQDTFWEQEALEKLPELRQATNMLICGEDLGMVPDCVPGVMRALGLLSLEIQRMPKAPGAAFFHPKDAPYLSVVTPSTHDMSTIRGWWEEDRAQTDRFYREIMGRDGEAPWFCEPWINRTIVAQHVHSPAMWSIFQLQDLMGIDGTLRRENPDEERINVPANPKHYWRYRMHLTLEALQKEVRFNTDLRGLLLESGRC
jgi:4-alpha-glucanotransferase